MNSIFKIRLPNPSPTNTYISPQWLTGSELYFDTDQETNISLNKEIQTLTDINKITVETALDTSLPATTKNLGILGISMDVEGIDNDYPEHDIEIDFGFNILTQTSLKVTGYDRASNRIDIELSDISDNWVLQMQSIFLDSFDLGTFEYTRDNIIANWEADGFYNDGDAGYWLGHGFYGRYVKQGVLSEGDLRPLVHAKKLVDLTSKAIGKKIVCPILETDTGRRIGHYLLKNDYLKDKDTLDLRRFEAKTVDKAKTLAVTGDNPQKVIFPQEIVDNGNNYNSSTGIFTGAGVYNFTAKIYPEIYIGDKTWLTGTSFFSFTLAVQKVDGTEDILEEVEWSNANGEFSFKKLNTDGQLTLTKDNVLVLPGEKVYVRYKRSDSKVSAARILAGSTFFCEPISLIIQPGDVIDIGKQLRHDTALDYFKGLCHLFKFMILEDKFSNTLYFLTPYDLDFFGDSVSGYFNSTQKDLRARIIQNTEKYFQITKPEKNRLYSFKKSTDARIEKLELPEYAPLYSKFIDNGFDRKSEMETFENPYFEPTYMDSDPSLNGTGLEILSEAGYLHVPYMVDNLYGQFSFNIAPRIFIFHGYTPLYYRKVYDDGTYAAKQITYYIWDKTNVNVKIPYVAQVAVTPTSITGAAHPNPTFNVPSAKIAFGDYEDDLYQLIYKKHDRDFRDLPYMTAKIQTTDDEYISEQFRNRVLIDSPNIHTGDLLGRITKISSFDPEQKTAEITFIADKQISDDCIGYEVPNLCQNYAQLVIEQVGTVYNLSLGGTYTSTPDWVTFKWKYLQSKIWHDSNEVDTPIDNVEIYMTVQWEDSCPPIVIQGFIKVDKNPKINFSRDGNIVTATEAGEYGLTVANKVITYTLDGTNWKLYSSGIDVSKTTAKVIQFHVKTTFTEADATPAEADIFYSNVVHLDECPNPDSQPHPPSVAWSKVKTGATYGYSLYKIGSYAGAEAYDFIQFREKGKNQEWTEYNNVILAKTLNNVPVIWECQRVLIWCGETGCAPYCSPIVEIDGNDYNDTLLTVVESGTTGTTAAHEQKWENPDDASSNWKVEPLDNEIYHVPELRSYIEQTIGMSTTDIQDYNVIWDRWNYRTQYVYTWNINYKINSIELSPADFGGIGTQFTIPIDVLYESGNSNDYLTDQIESVIHEQLNLLGYIEDVHYVLYLTVTGTTTKTLNLGFIGKHNPTDTWIGINNGTDQMEIEYIDTTLSYVTGSGKEFQLVTTSAPIVENYSPYGTQFKVRLKVSTINHFLDDSLSNFNEFIPNSPCPIVDEMMSDSLTDTGKKFSLSASLSGCAGTSSFIWLFAGLNRGGSGDVISYTSSCEVYTNVIQDIKILGSCDTATYCTYEKLIRLTP